MSDRYDVQRERIIEAMEVATKAVCALSVSDCDGGLRALALTHLSGARKAALAGIEDRRNEYRRNEAWQSLTAEQRSALMPFMLEQ